MYTLAFLIGFCTSFGWWTAGKFQRAIDTTSITLPAPIKGTTNEQ